MRSPAPRRSPPRSPAAASSRTRGVGLDSAPDASKRPGTWTGSGSRRLNRRQWKSTRPVLRIRSGGWTIPLPTTIRETAPISGSRQWFRRVSIWWRFPVTIRPSRGTIPCMSGSSPAAVPAQGPERGFRGRTRWGWSSFGCRREDSRWVPRRMRKAGMPTRFSARCGSVVASGWGSTR